ncbi:MAG: hypothetical protein NZ951_04620 [Dehalococcoidia bacterium]|nr:hypothetical protein [Dehalococcoidia bacterium]MDW8120333.1 hypothetical protein [Chloroflexota bacterium]
MASEEHPQVSIYLFPHLEEFLVTDTRPEVPGTPRVLFIPWREALDTTFYQEVERAFSEALREQEPFPLAHLMVLPTRLEGILREAGLKAILRRLDIPPESPSLPRIGVFLVAGQALARSGRTIAEALGELVDHLAPPSFQAQAAQALQRFLEQEHETLRRLERQYLQKALLGEEPGFYTLWQQPKDTP